MKRNVMPHAYREVKVKLRSESRKQKVKVCTDPSLLMRSALEPVPAIRTIPPASAAVARVPTVSLQT